MPDFAAFRIKHADVRPASFEPDHFVPVVSFRVEQHDGFLRLRRAGQVERHLLRQFVVTRPLEGRQQTESLPLVVIDGHEDSGAPGPDATLRALNNGFQNEMAVRSKHDTSYLRAIDSALMLQCIVQ